MLLCDYFWKLLAISKNRQVMRWIKHKSKYKDWSIFYKMFSFIYNF